VPLQLPLPGIRQNLDPATELHRISRDKAELRHQVRLMLDAIAELHGIARKTVDAVMWDHADDLIEALFDDRQREIEAEAEAAIEREDWTYGEPFRRA
jgi:hypothetical protein